MKKKRTPSKTLYTLTWEILEAAELVSALPGEAPVPKSMLYRIYKGNGLRLFESHTVPRNWSVEIVTQAKADNGEMHSLKMSFKPDGKVSLTGLVNHIKGMWIDECDKVLAGMTAIRADATARCMV